MSSIANKSFEGSGSLTVVVEEPGFEEWPQRGEVSAEVHLVLRGVDPQQKKALGELLAYYEDMGESPQVIVEFEDDGADDPSTP